MKDIHLNEQQQDALKKLRKWFIYKTSPTFEIAGAAGTGKTTLIRYLIEESKLGFEEVLFMAYVGKATLAMSLNGLNAKTIHSTICVTVDEPIRDEEGRFIFDENGKKLTRPRFHRKDKIDPKIKLFVVDEGGMVPKKLGKWLLSYGIPTIVLGDLRQLPPVFGGNFFLKKPDVVLTQIMRQAGDSPIPYFASKISLGAPLRECEIGGKIHCISREHFDPMTLGEYDVVLCGTNKTRNKLNQYIRTNIYKLDQPYPMIGDRLICRENNWELKLGDNIYLINGLIGIVEDIDLATITKTSMRIDFRPEFLEEKFCNLLLDRKYMNLTFKEREHYMSTMEKFEYGYAITTHLAQGSQYNKVLIYVEQFGGEKFFRKWLYTGVTRAIDDVTLII